MLRQQENQAQTATETYLNQIEKQPE